MIKTYRKTATIKAEQFDGTIEMTRRYSIKWGPQSADDSRVKFWLPTLEGEPEIYPDDWIATGNDGEHWPIADDVFKRTHAELPVIPKVVADKIENYKLVYGLFALLYEAEEFGVPRGYATWIVDHAELVARAWLDGYTVEGE